MDAKAMLERAGSPSPTRDIEVDGRPLIAGAGGGGGYSSGSP